MLSELSFISHFSNHVHLQGVQTLPGEGLACCGQFCNCLQGFHMDLESAARSDSLKVFRDTERLESPVVADVEKRFNLSCRAERAKSSREPLAAAGGSGPVLYRGKMHLLRFIPVHCTRCTTPGFPWRWRHRILLR